MGTNRVGTPEAGATQGRTGSGRHTSHGTDRTECAITTNNRKK